MTPAIRVENLGKCYRLGVTHARSLNELASRFTRRMRGLPPVQHAVDRPGVPSAPGAKFWALKDVSFDVSTGQVIGVIGRNGAGKSTLLKILSRITKPSVGRIEIAGRVGSLLEVGTGFHPELTGRENVYMNGTLLGMMKREVARKFDEIVEFAGVERFIDTPVKRYSSGMKVRLGFAVAAHLEPEVLLVDEVLAVGDAAFQERCFDAIQDIATSGRTVILVSHQMTSIRQLCSAAIYLEQGRLSLCTKDVDEAVRRYVGAVRRPGLAIWSRETSHAQRAGHPSFTPLRFSLRDGAGQTISSLLDGKDEVWVHIEGSSQEEDPNLSVGYALCRRGTPLYWSYFGDGDSPVRLEGAFHLRSQLPLEWLNPGHYDIELVAGLHRREWFYQPGMSEIVLPLDVAPTFHSSRRWFPERPTPVAPVLSWERCR